MSFRTLKITLCYDGTDFVGWQRQAAGTSIQGLLEEALSRIDGAGVTVVGAGRTDAGVHALGQAASANVVSDLGVATLRRALNAMLPPEVRVTNVETAAPGFNARYGARRKEYRYRIINAEIASPFERRYAWHVSQPLDVVAMRAAAASLEGTHDFSAFQAAGSGVATSVRSLVRSAVLDADRGAALGLIDLPAAGRLIAYEAVGDGFLRHMVRTIVGTLIEVGSGRRTPGSMAATLA